MQLSNIKKILVPYDLSLESVKGLKFALYLSKKVKASITLIHVIPHKSLKYRNKGVEKLSREHIAKIVKSSSRVFKFKSKTLERKHNIKIDSVVKVGRIEKTICETAKLNGYDLIIMGTKERIYDRNKSIPGISRRVSVSSDVPVFKVTDTVKYDNEVKENWIQAGLNIMKETGNSDLLFIENSLLEKGIPDEILHDAMTEIKKYTI